MRSRLLFLILAIASFGYAAIACSGESLPADAGSDATVADTSPPIDTGVQVDAPVDAPVDAGKDVAPDDLCKAMARPECLSCCTTTHPSGATIFGNAITSCVCEPDKCGDACAPTCTGDASPGPSCVNCVNIVIPLKGDAGCQDKIGATCSASQACKDYFACTLGCPN